jgi:hypothetical protein
MAPRNRVEHRLIAAELEIVEDQGLYKLTYDDATVKTSYGAEVVHSSKSLLRNMIAEFDMEGSIRIIDRVIASPRFFGAYALFSIQKEFIEQRKEELSVSLEPHLLRDPILRRCAGPEVSDQMARWSPVLEFLREHGQKLPSLPQGMSREDIKEEVGLKLNDFGFTESFVSFIRDQYQSLSGEWRTVVMYLSAVHHGPVLLPIVLAKALCTPDEYASGVMAADCTLAGVFGVKANQHRKEFISLRDYARTAIEYVRHSGQ